MLPKNHGQRRTKTIRAMITFLLIVSVTGFLALGGLGIWSLRQVVVANRTIINDGLLPLLSNEVTELIEKKEIAIQLILEADRDVHQVAIAEKMALGADESDLDAIREDHQSNIGQARDRVGKAVALVKDDRFQSLHDEFTSSLELWITETNKVVADSQVPEHLNAARASSTSGAARKTFNTMRDVLDTMTEELNVQIAAGMERIGSERKRCEGIATGVETANMNFLRAFTASAIGLTIAVITFGLIITRTIVRSVSQAVEQLDRGATQVAAASSQVAESSQTLAGGASEQASSLEEVSSSLEEVSSMVSQTAGNTNEVDTIMKGEVAAGLARISNTMTEMRENLTDAVKASTDTQKIIKTIDEIAFQTNLLALNAAVEAARAGEAGKGFAVVAEEVRNLAQRSAEAAKTTQELIANSTDKVSQARTLYEQVSEAMDKNAELGQKVGVLVGEIRDASGEQAQAIEQVNAGVAQMNELTQSNAASAEESASASEELSAQSNELTNIVASLSQLVGGDVAHETGTISSDRPQPPRHAAHLRESRRIESARQNRPRIPVHASRVNPDEIIPLADDDLSDF